MRFTLTERIELQTQFSTVLVSTRSHFPCRTQTQGHAVCCANAYSETFNAMELPAIARDPTWSIRGRYLAAGQAASIATSPLPGLAGH